MPTDLDELFAAVGRQADAIPLVTAEQARRRGRQRTRTQLTAVAAAVLAVAVGVAGFLARAPRHDDQTVAPTPSGRALPEVGSPIPLPDAVEVGHPAIAGGRAFTVWTTTGHALNLTAVDLHTGAPVWTTRVADAPEGTLTDTRADAQAVTVTVTPPGGTEQTFFTYRPADGRLIWQRPAEQADPVLLHDQVLVHTSARTGRTDAYDRATGALRWWLPASADRVGHLLGMRTATGQMSGSYTDDRFLQVTKSGKVQVRDIRTGTLTRTVTLPQRTALAADATVVAYDGWLFHTSVPCCDTAAYEVSATDLGTGRSKVVLSEGVGHEFGLFDLCGTRRLCVLDKQRDQSTEVVAVDAVDGREIWRVPGPAGADGISGLGEDTVVGGGGATVVLDRNGRSAFRTPDAGVQWLAPDRLLITPDNVAGTALTVTISTRKLDRLGDLPLRTGPCAYTTERLICPEFTRLRVWSLTG